MANVRLHRAFRPARGAGPLLGVVLLLLSDHCVNFINLAGALGYTLTVPFAPIELALYSFDLETRGGGEARPA